MNKIAASRSAGDEWASSSVASISSDGCSIKRLQIVDKAISSADWAQASRSFVSISVDAEGHIDFESEVEPQHADQMTDALLLMLLKAREARKRS